MAGTTSIEDILSSEVDENALSALIGSLESKVASQSAGASAGQSQESSSNTNHVSDTPVSSASASGKQPVQKSVDNNTTHGHRNSASTTGTGKNSNSGVKSSASSTPSNSHVNKDVNKESGGATVVIKDNKINTKSNVNINNSSNSNSKTNSTPTSCVRIITLPTSSGGQVLATDQLTQAAKNTTVTVSNSRTQQTSSGPVKVVTTQGLQSVAVPTTTLQPVPTTSVVEGGLKMTVREQLAKQQQEVVTKPSTVTTTSTLTPHVVLQPAPTSVTRPATSVGTSIVGSLTSTPIISTLTPTTGGPKVVTVNVSAPNSSLSAPGMPGQQVIMSNVVGGTLPTTVKSVAPQTAQVLNHPMRIAGHQMIAPRPGGPTGPIQVRLPPGTNLPPNVVLINNKDGSLQAVQVGGTIAQPGNIPGTVTYRHVQPGTLIAPRGQSPTIIQPHQQVIAPGGQGKHGTPVVVSVAKPGQPNMTIVSKQMVSTTMASMPGGTRTVAPVTIGVPPHSQMSQSASQPSSSSGAPLQIPMSQSAIENVKKCKNFLTTLIKLASNANQAPETVQNVKDLVQNLIDGRIEPEEFTLKLQKELHSSPQPYLVPFLKKSLPLLRQTLQRSGATTLQGITQQSLQSPVTASIPTSVKSSKAATVTVGSSSKHTLISTIAAGAPVGKTATINISAQQLEQIAQRHGKAGLQQLQQLQQLAQKAKTQVKKGQPQGQLVTTTIGGQTKTIFLPHSAILGAQAQAQAAAAAAGKSGGTPKAVSGSAKPSRAGATPSRKDKGKEHGGAASFKDDDDINDVASMAGVNLSEESARIMATNADFIGTQMRSIKEEKFLITGPLHQHVNRLCQKHGLQNASSEVMDLISLATQERLKLLTEKLGVIAGHRMEGYRNDSRFEVTSDVKTQLKVFEQLDSLERKRREEQEREILMRAAKSRSKQEDPEQLKLKQRAKEMQQMELEQMRQKEANLTALAAIGSRKKRKVDSPTPGSVPGGPGQATGSPFSTNFTTGSTSRRRPMPRIKRVNLRDVIFLLEQERETKKSQLLFKSFLK